MAEETPAARLRRRSAVLSELECARSVRARTVSGRRRAARRAILHRSLLSACASRAPVAETA
jgi:hypothetical protein